MHVGSVLQVLASASHVYSASADGTVAVWDTAAATAGEPALLAHLVDHTDKVSALALAFGCLFSGSADKSIRRWALPVPEANQPERASTAAQAQAQAAAAAAATEWACTLSWRAHDAALSCLVAATALGLLCSGAEDGRLRLWRLAPPAFVATATSTTLLNSAAAAAAPTEAALVATLCGAAPLKPLRTLCVEPTRGEVLCAGASDGTVYVWNLSAHVLLHTLRAHIGNAVRALCFGASGAFYVAGSDSRVVVWSMNMDEEEVATQASSSSSSSTDGPPPPSTVFFE